MITSLKYKLEKLDLLGIPGKKDIVVLKIEEDFSVDQMKSLQEEIKNLKSEAGWKDIIFLILPKHISLVQLSDDDLDKIGLCRK